MKKTRFLAILILTMSVVLFYAQPALAFPSMPSSFYGTVKVDGASVPIGTVVSAKIIGVQYASAAVFSYQEDIYYSLDIPADDPDTPGTIEGGVEGNTIVFYIGTTKAAQTGTWHSGSLVSLNLTVDSSLEPSVSIFLPFILR